MKTKRNILFTAFLTIVLASVACEGPAGPQGLQGERGPSGSPGPEGTANVISSEWLDIEWDVDGSFIKEMYIAEPLITEEFIETGTALMFIRVEEENVAHPLPFLIGSDFLTFTIVNDPENHIGLIYQVLSQDGSPAGSYSDLQIRYILIPDGITASGKAASGREEYNAVKEYFGRPEQEGSGFAIDRWTIFDSCGEFIRKSVYRSIGSSQII